LTLEEVEVVFGTGAGQRVKEALGKASPVDPKTPYVRRSRRESGIHGVTGSITGLRRTSMRWMMKITVRLWATGTTWPNCRLDEGERKKLGRRRWTSYGAGIRISLVKLP